MALRRAANKEIKRLLLQHQHFSGHAGSLKETCESSSVSVWLKGGHKQNRSWRQNSAHELGTSIALIRVGNLHQNHLLHMNL